MELFVGLKWGHSEYDLMKQIEHLFDPSNLMNPGVTFDNDPKIRIKKSKALPRANEIIYKCIECGFCEDYCSSRDLSVSRR